MQEGLGPHALPCCWGCWLGLSRAGAQEGDVAGTCAGAERISSLEPSPGGKGSSAARVHPPAFRGWGWHWEHGHPSRAERLGQAGRKEAELFGAERVI